MRTKVPFSNKKKCLSVVDSLVSFLKLSPIYFNLLKLSLIKKDRALVELAFVFTKF